MNQFFFAARGKTTLGPTTPEVWLIAPVPRRGISPTMPPTPPARSLVIQALLSASFLRLSSWRRAITRSPTEISGASRRPLAETSVISRRVASPFARTTTPHAATHDQQERHRSGPRARAIPVDRFMVGRCRRCEIHALLIHPTETTYLSRTCRWHQHASPGSAAVDCGPTQASRPNAMTAAPG
jgi:hypothetical protein